MHLRHLVLFSAFSSTSAFGQLGVNLVQNHSFESFTADSTSAGTVAVEGRSGRFRLNDWVTQGTFTLDRYDGAFPPTTGTPANAGEYYLFGTSTALSTLEQRVDLTFASALIDMGDAGFLASALLGSLKFFNSNDFFQDDIATLTISFRDQVDIPISLITMVGPNFPSEVGAPMTPGNFHGLISSAGSVPVSARSAVIAISLTRDPDSSGFNNANVDRVEFTVVPSPGSVGMLMILAMVVRRRR